MKKINILLLGILSILFVGCEGSEEYRGKWKATDLNGVKFEINFDAENFTVKDSLGKKTKHKYTQNSVEINNSVATYGITLSDGRNYLVNFPNTENGSIAFIKDGNGKPIYTIGREKFIIYDEVYKLN